MDCDAKAAFIVEQQKIIRRLATSFATQAQLTLDSVDGISYCRHKDYNEGIGPTPELAVINFLDNNKM